MLQFCCFDDGRVESTALFYTKLLKFSSHNFLHRFFYCPQEKSRYNVCVCCNYVICLLHGRYANGTQGVISLNMQFCAFKASFVCSTSIDQTQTCGCRTGNSTSYHFAQFRSNFRRFSMHCSQKTDRPLSHTTQTQLFGNESVYCISQWSNSFKIL